MSTSNRKSKLIIYLPAAGLALVLLFVVISFSSGERIVQPIAYNHKVHLDNAGLNCADCHVHAADLPSAAIPTLELCQSCHSTDPVSQSPEELKVLKYVAEQKEIPWVRVYKVPDHVYFSHRRHVTIGALECSLCHGNMNEQTTPVSTQFMPVTMENCMNCHKQRNVTNDCLSCHR